MPILDQIANLNAVECETVHQGVDHGGQPLLSRISPATVVLAAQIGCFVLRLVAGRFTRHVIALTYVGLALAALGIGVGAHMCRVGLRGRGVHCAIASVAMVLFWRLQLQLAHDPLFLY